MIVCIRGMKFRIRCLKGGDEVKQIKVSVTERQERFLREQAEERGVPVAEIIRRIIDDVIDKMMKKER